VALGEHREVRAYPSANSLISAVALCHHRAFSISRLDTEEQVLQCKVASKGLGSENKMPRARFAPGQSAPHDEELRLGTGTHLAPAR